MRAGTLLIASLVVFGLLSLTDYAQTFALISDSNGRVYEANPVAEAWLERFGWAGLAVFKAGTVAVFVGASILLARRRPQAGAAIAAFGCVALLVVTSYSHSLLTGISPPTELREVAADQHFSDDITIIESAPIRRAPFPGWPPPAIPR